MGDVTPDPGQPPTGLSAPVPLTVAHDLGSFDCGEPVLDDWLKHRALRNESRFSRTYVVCDGDRIAAYYCIAAGAVQRAAAPGRLRRNAPDAVPVSVIGRLAVERADAGRGRGGGRRGAGRRRHAITARRIGIGAVLVQAKDDRARRFHMACAEFIEYPADSRTLFLPIETVVAAFD